MIVPESTDEVIPTLRSYPSPGLPNGVYYAVAEFDDTMKTRIIGVIFKSGRRWGWCDSLHPVEIDMALAYFGQDAKLGMRTAKSAMENLYADGAR